MTIAESTRLQAYQLRPGGTRARMAILRMIAADSVNNRNPDTRLRPGDWRKARHWTLNGYEAAYAMLSQGAPGSWYSHTGPEFRNERDAHEIIARLPRGWYTDKDCHETAVGIVACLPHGRFIAGYRWTSNDERVYFNSTYDDEDEAARAADGHAERFADDAREDDIRFNAMQDAESKVESLRAELADTRALRRAGRRDTAQVCECIETLREAIDARATATKEYERG